MRVFSLRYILFQTLTNVQVLCLKFVFITLASLAAPEAGIEAAKQDFEQCLSLDPTDPKAFQRLAALLRGNPDMLKTLAVKQCACFVVDPADPKAFLHLAALQSENQEMAIALLEHGSAVVAPPLNAGVLTYADVC